MTSKSCLRQQLENELFTASLSSETKVYDIHHMPRGEALRLLDKWVGKAYDGSKKAICIVHGNCTEDRRNDLTNYLKGDEHVHCTGYVAPNFGRLYVLLKNNEQRKSNAKT